MLTAQIYVCFVRDAAKEYLRVDGRRTPYVEEAKVFASVVEAKAACSRATDRVVAMRLA